MVPVQRFILSTVVAATAFLGATAVSAQVYPSQPIHVFMGETGNTADLITRIIQPDLEKALGQPIVIENREGQLLEGILRTAKPDGYTVGFGSGSIWLKAEEGDYDPLVEFTAITLAARTPFILLRNVGVPFKTVPEVVAYAKANPGKLKMAVSRNLGSSSTLAADLFASYAGINFLSVPYSGVSDQRLALMRKEVDVAFIAASSGAKAIEAGDLLPIAVTSETPSDLVPGLPTVASYGYDGFEMLLLSGVFVPGKTPKAVVDRLGKEFLAALKKPENKEKIFKLNAEVVANTPEEFEKQLRSAIANIKRVLESRKMKKG